MERIALFILLLVLTTACHETDSTEVYQSSRDNVIKVKNLIHRIDEGDVFIGRYNTPFVYDDYLFIEDNFPTDFCLHVFNKNDYKYVTSFAPLGQGPNEFTNTGGISWNAAERELYLPDLTKYSVAAFNLDSVIANPDYKSYEKYTLRKDTIPVDFHYICDTFTLCQVVVPTSDFTFDSHSAVINLQTGKITCREYNRSDIHKRRFGLALSLADSIYAECNYLYDFISIFDLKGNLLRNIYGPQWGTLDLQCHSDEVFTNDYLITLYNGEIYEDNLPNRKCFVFSKSGDYIATLDMEYSTLQMCYDESHDRLIFSFDDEFQFGYLDLKDLKLK
ncbi:MAG: hypothetical protein J6Y82_01110 [Bacteroidales bacterium]|nr:hypothetical protein [Bacteroidales bacterium]